MSEAYEEILRSLFQRERALKGESLWHASHIHTVPLLLRAFTVTVLKRDRISCCVKMALETSLINRTEKDITLHVVICQCTDQKTEMLYILSKIFPRRHFK